MKIVSHSGVPVPARSLWYVAPGRAEIRSTVLPCPGPDDARIRTLYSGISRGTERLVARGLHDPIHRARMRAPMQDGEFPFPVKYGYCAVGRVENGPSNLAGKTVFVLHPHQDLFVAPAGLLALVPDSVPPKRATLAANMETALNALWDSGAGPGERIVIVGAGTVGLLVTYLAARIPGTDVTVIDPQAGRRTLVERFGGAFSPQSDRYHEADVVFHTSATARGLATAMAAGGMEATVVEMSWYGDENVAVPFGGDFHSRRLKIVSSQVGLVSGTRRVRWTHARRLAKALELLADPLFDALVETEVAFADLPEALSQILAPSAPGLAPVIRYD